MAVQSAAAARGDDDAGFTEALLANNLMEYSFDVDALRQWMITL